MSPKNLGLVDVMRRRVRSVPRKGEIYFVPVQPGEKVGACPIDDVLEELRERYPNGFTGAQAFQTLNEIARRLTNGRYANFEIGVRRGTCGRMGQYPYIETSFGLYNDLLKILIDRGYLIKEKEETRPGRCYYRWKK